MAEMRGVPIVQGGEDSIRITERISALVEMTITTVEIDCKIKNGDIKAEFWEITSQDMLYKSKEILKGETKKKTLAFRRKILYLLMSRWHLLPKSYSRMLGKNVGKLVQRNLH